MERIRKKHTINKHRDGSIDLLKFFAIYMVVLGHSLGRLGLDMGVLDHPIGKAIVMVNMPLFIFVTGYFGKSLFPRSLRELIVVKYESLVRPTLFFSLLTIVVCDIILQTVQITILGCVSLLISRVIYGYWFIWVVLYCSFYSWLLVKVGDRLNINRAIILLLSMFLLLIVPDTPYIPCISSFKAMYPFFLLGLLYREKLWLDKSYSYKRIILPISLIGFLIVYYYYKGVWSFYYFPLTPFPLVAYYYLLMLVVGICGIIFLYILLRTIWEQNKQKKITIKLAELGQYSLAIYLIQGVFVEIADLYQQQLLINDYFALTMISLIVSVILITFISTMVFQIKKNKILSAYLLGK